MASFPGRHPQRTGPLALSSSETPATAGTVQVMATRTGGVWARAYLVRGGRGTGRPRPGPARRCAHTFRQPMGVLVSPPPPAPGSCGLGFTVTCQEQPVQTGPRPGSPGPGHLCSSAFPGAGTRLCSRNIHICLVPHGTCSREPAAWIRVDA